jgi:AmmeMemoRadiSam system protein A
MNKNDLLDLAYDAIEAGFDNSSVDTLALKTKDHDLAQKGATFITLNLDGELRGCIGSLVAHRDLADDIAHNAKAAAFDDVRFHPLSKEEFERVDIEISILNEPQPLHYHDNSDLKSKIRVGIDGVILRSGNRQATFLPFVWDQLPTFESFFERLCLKAGCESNCLDQHPDIFIYHANKVK